MCDNGGVNAGMARSTPDPAIARQFRCTINAWDSQRIVVTETVSRHTVRDNAEMRLMYDERLAYKALSKFVYNPIGRILLPEGPS